MTNGIPVSNDLGLSEYTKRGGVTTLVTATKDVDEDELERVQSIIPPNVITVESEHVVEVESNRVSGTGSEIRAARMESTEELFRKL
jgi:hypothetical protein